MNGSADVFQLDDHRDLTAERRSRWMAAAVFGMPSSTVELHRSMADRVIDHFGDRGVAVDMRTDELEFYFEVFSDDERSAKEEARRVVFGVAQFAGLSISHLTTLGVHVVEGPTDNQTHLHLV